MSMFFFIISYTLSAREIPIVIRDISAQNINENYPHIEIAKEFVVDRAFEHIEALENYNYKNIHTPLVKEVLSQVIEKFHCRKNIRKKRIFFKRQNLPVKTIVEQNHDPIRVRANAYLKLFCDKDYLHYQNYR
ncbi:MAG: hypothetical protein H6622_00475 [Halobacteriovoraceae bacterium]|nr:hypothetical protein [Halobacteriovoraceae bacterium]